MTVGDDKTIKVWGAEEESWSDLPRDTVVSKNMVTGLTISATGDTFATCGEATQLWTRGRHVPSRTFQWGVDTIHHVRFNPVETHLLGATSADRYLGVKLFLLQLLSVLQSHSLSLLHDRRLRKSVIDGSYFYFSF